MQIFAHRGFSAEYPENTLLAMEAALSINVMGKSVTGIELDVQLVDGEAVVFHDRRLERCTNGRGWIDNLSLSQLKQLDAGRGERVPLLIEVMELVQNHCLLNIEIKHPSVLKPTFMALEDARHRLGVSQSQIIFSSFYHSVLLETARYYPGAEHAALVASVPLNVSEFLSPLPVQALHGCINALCGDFVEQTRKLGKLFRMYTVDEPEDLSRLRAMGGSGIFCNDPLTALQHLNG